MLPVGLVVAGLPWVPLVAVGRVVPYWGAFDDLGLADVDLAPYDVTQGPAVAVGVSITLDGFTSRTVLPTGAQRRADFVAVAAPQRPFSGVS